MKGIAALARSRKNKDTPDAASGTETSAAETRSGEIEDAEVIEETPAETAGTDTGADGDAPGDGTVPEEDAPPSGPEDADTGTVEADAAVAADADGEDGTDSAADDPRSDPEDAGTGTEEAVAAEAEGEDGTPAEPEVPEDQPPPAAMPPAPERRSAMPMLLALVAGGAIAGLVGFFAARQIDAMNEEPGPTPVENAAALAASEARSASV